jgi:hypothetical protein
LEKGNDTLREEKAMREENYRLTIEDMTHKKKILESHLIEKEKMIKHLNSFRENSISKVNQNFKNLTLIRGC